MTSLALSIGLIASLKRAAFAYSFNIQLLVAVAQLSRAKEITLSIFGEVDGAVVARRRRC